MAELFYAEIGNTLFPIAADAVETLAEWVSDPTEKDRGIAIGRLRQLFALAFTEVDPIFLLRTSAQYDGEVSYPIGDEILSEAQAAGHLAGAGIELSEALSETAKRLSHEIQGRSAARAALTTKATIAVSHGQPILVFDVDPPPSEGVGEVCPYEILDGTLFIRTELAATVPLTPSEAKSLTPLIAAYPGFVNMGERDDVPRNTYSNHLGSIIRKIHAAGLPVHIQTPGGPGRGSAYRITPKPL